MIRFGTLGAARITPRALVQPCMDEPGAFIRVIAARDRTQAEGFAHHHNIGTVLDSYDDVINSPKINAVYNPLPISAHREWSIKALRAGKHVLCEKSLASNAEEAQEMASVAAETGLILMDAFHYRYHPLFVRAKQIFDSGELGEIQQISAAFHVMQTPAANDIRMIFETAGGVTMDIGCYPISWVRHITGAEPRVISAVAEEGPPGIDLFLEATMEFPGGIIATTSGDMRPGQFKAELEVTGTRKRMRVVNPLVPQNGHSLEIFGPGGENRTETFDRRSSYAYQLDAFMAAIEKGVPPITDAEDAVRQMRVIDQCYDAAGLPRRGT